MYDVTKRRQAWYNARKSFLIRKLYFKEDLKMGLPGKWMESPEWVKPDDVDLFTFMDTITIYRVIQN